MTEAASKRESIAGDKSRFRTVRKLIYQVYISGIQSKTEFALEKGQVFCLMRVKGENWKWFITVRNPFVQMRKGV